MKTIFKSLFLFVALSLAVPVFSQSNFEATKVRAEAGDAEAQFNLGTIYRKGEGVAQNDSRAYVWLSVAAAQGHADAAAPRDLVRGILSPQALEQAQAQATRCFESNFKDCD